MTTQAIFDQLTPFDRFLLRCLHQHPVSLTAYEVDYGRLMAFEHLIQLNLVSARDTAPVQQDRPARVIETVGVGTQLAAAIARDTWDNAHGIW